MKVDICLPIKNEENIISQNVETIISFLKSRNLNFDWRIVGIINGSNDNSFEIFRGIKNKYPNLVECYEVIEPGKGRAIKYAWNKSDADILMFMDIDLAVPLRFISNLLTPIINNEADLVIGSRFLSSSVIDRSYRRRLISRGYIFISHCFLNHSQTDMQCGFKAIKNETFKKIENNLINDNWFFDTELVIYAQLCGARIKEIPVNWQERKELGKKSNIKIISDSFNFIANTFRLRNNLSRDKKKIG